MCTLPLSVDVPSSFFKMFTIVKIINFYIDLRTRLSIMSVPNIRVNLNNL